MSDQLLLGRQASEVVAKHFKCSLRRLAACPQIDQHASDNRTIRLNLDAVLTVANQVRTAQ